MRWHWRLLFGLAALLMATGIFLSLHPSQQAARGDTRIGSLAPDFTLHDLRGEPVTLLALRGRPVLLNFWATYCPPCVQEMPALERVYLHYHLRRPAMAPAILGIDAGAEDKPTVAGFARHLAVTYPLLLDPVFQVTLVAYHVYNIPTSILIDSRGATRSVYLGAQTYAEFLHGLDQLR